MISLSSAPAATTTTTTTYEIEKTLSSTDTPSSTTTTTTTTMANSAIASSTTEQSSTTTSTRPNTTKPTTLNKSKMNGIVVSTKPSKRLSNFYENKDILITGVTGFIGKVCLLKILTSLGNCNKVYVLLRAKKGMTPQQRFNKMLNEEPFVNYKQLRDQQQLQSNDSSNHQMNNNLTSNLSSIAKLTETENPRVVVAKLEEEIKNLPPIDWSKVVPVDGDMSSENLGFNRETQELLASRINIVFNIAASVQFDAPLKQNLRDNYMGVRNILQLSMKFEKLISFVHVSTFYSNSHQRHIEEKVLPMNRDCEKMADLISWIPDSLCDSIGPQIMENRPNTYIFTKAMAENLVQKFQGRFPIAIVRPSIVTPSIRDPYPGWVDNVNGPMGLGILAALGILRNIDWNYDGVADYIPVDLVVNSMLAIAERTARQYPKEIKVYNCSTSSTSPVTWGQSFEVLRSESLTAPPYKMLRVPIKVPNHQRVNKIAFKLTKLSELLFAYFIDFILVICGQKALLTRLTSKLHHGYEILKPFTTTEYTCSNDNILAAFDELSEEDKKDFDFDIRRLDWEKSFLYAYYGARRRLLKEDLSNLPSAIFKMKILMIVEFLFKGIFYVFLGWQAIKLYNMLSAQSLISLK